MFKAVLEYNDCGPAEVVPRTWVMECRREPLPALFVRAVRPARSAPRAAAAGSRGQTTSHTLPHRTARCTACPRPEARTGSLTQLTQQHGTRHQKFTIYALTRYTVSFPSNFSANSPISSL